MRERLRNFDQKQQWQAESLQGFQETVAGVHTRHQAEARRHGQGRLPQGYGPEDDSRLQQKQGNVLDPFERYRGDITVYPRKRYRTFCGNRKPTPGTWHGSRVSPRGRVPHL